jgi:hypothetical protein
VTRPYVIAIVGLAGARADESFVSVIVGVVEAVVVRRMRLVLGLAAG